MVDVPLGDYCRGFVTLIVNIASGCGLTEKNYAQLTQLDKDYGDRMQSSHAKKSQNSMKLLYLCIFSISELRILSFPSNQFGGQMPEGDGDEMLCHFKVRSAEPGGILAKINVNGDSAIPLFKYLKDKLKGEQGADLEWNFVKFLVNKNGQPVKRYDKMVEPMAILDDIKNLF